MMGRIFISYRRADSQYATDRIYEKLAAQFGADSVFMDIDDIPLGVNFRDYIDQQVSTSDIVLAVIGDHWLSAVDADGNLRLQNPGDFVRLEIEAALCQGIKLIPVFIGDVHSLPVSKLPESMRDLPMLNATRIRRGTDFTPDVERLIRGIVRVNEEQAARREANVAALAALKQSTAEIKSRLSSFEAVMIQEMRKRAELEDEVQRLEELVSEHLSDPAKQLRVDVQPYRQQIEKLKERLLELSLQIEARKQGKPFEELPTAKEKLQPVPAPEPEERFALKKAVKPAPVRRAEPGVRTAEKINIGKLLRKVPVWAWGGLALVVLGAIFGPVLWKSISAPLSEPTMEPSEQPQQTILPAEQAKQAWLSADRDFVFWMDSLTGTSPDYLEDYSIEQPYWFGREISPGIFLADNISEGVHNLVASPVTETYYAIFYNTGSDFIVQFDFTPHEFAFGSRLRFDIRQNDSINYLFEFQPSGEWNLYLETPTGRDDLAAGKTVYMNMDFTYKFQLFAWGDQLAVLLDGNLLAYVQDSTVQNGNNQISLSSYKPIDVEIDNIKFWDLSDTEYLQPREQDQAEAFYAPIREYLASAAPTFQEDFETYQPYWEEMQVNFNDNKPVDLAALVQDEGHILLNSNADLEYDQFRLNFPQLSAQAFAIQYDFAFYDLESTIIYTLMDAFWGPEDNREWYNTYCDFHQDRGEIWCGLNKVSGADEQVEIFNRSRPFYKDMSEPYTFLSIFYQGQTAIFLDGYFMGFTDGLDLFDGQISISFVNGSLDEEFGVRVEQIKFWDLEGIEIGDQPVIEAAPEPTLADLIRAYLEETSPDFADDFSEPNPDWGRDSAGALITNKIQPDGSLQTVDLSEDGEVRFPVNGLFNASSFALSFEIDWDQTNVGAFGLVFREDPTSFYKLKVSYSEHALRQAWLYSNTQRAETRTPDSGWLDLNESNHFLVIVYQNNLIVFANDELVFADPETEIFGEGNYFFGGGENIYWDNIQFWNLDEVELTP